MKKNKIFDIFRQNNIFMNIDLYAAELIAKKNHEFYNEIFSITAFLSYNLREKGHTCIPVDKIDIIFEEIKNEKNHDISLNYDFNAFFESDFFKNPNNPIVIDNNRIYLKKIKKYEDIIRDFIYSSQNQNIIFDIPKSFDKVFDNTHETDWQKISGICVLKNRFTAITGGPGTGKTTTVAKTICALLMDNSDLNIKLCAPTGKAAVRISESIKKAVDYLKKHGISQQILEKIPIEASTIHRLLGSRKFSTEFNHNEDNPIQADIIIVDEASMIDLSLMAKLVKSLEKNTKLVLVGDMDQLASVEAGSVFGDICRRGADNYSRNFIEKYIKNSKNIKTDDKNLKDSVVVLKKVHRFDENSGIGKFATCVNNMDYNKSSEILCEKENNIEYTEQFNIDGIIENIMQGYSEYLDLINSKEKNPEIIYNAFNRFRVLCSIRKGRFGTDNINEQICQRLNNNPAKKHFLGMPVIIENNYHNFKIYNGDTGIITYAETNEEKPLFTIICSNGEIRTISLGLINNWQPAFAMTIHKSQGSEFEEVITILSGNAGFLTKELLYTAVTRAKTGFRLYAEKQTLKETINKKVQRFSGL